MVKTAGLVPKTVGWFTLCTLTLKLLPADNVDNEPLFHGKEPVPPAPIDVLVIMVPTSASAFNRTSFIGAPAGKSV